MGYSTYMRFIGKITLQRIRKAIIRASFIFMFIHLYNLLIAPNYIDLSSKPYYDSFILEAQNRNMGLIKHFKVSIHIKSLPHTQLGNCSSVFGFKPVITLNSIHWNKLDYYQQEMVVYHELAHCLLLKGHGMKNQPDTLMTKSIFETTKYLANKDKYLKELFGYQSYHSTNFMITFFNLEDTAQLFGISTQ